MDEHVPKYCPQCGNALVSKKVEDKVRPYCPSCEQPIYRNPKPCAGVVVVKEDQLLLIKRAQPPRRGTWSVPAGFLEYDERPATAAVRELEEETGIGVPEEYLELFETTFVTTESRKNVVVIVYRVDYSQTEGELRAGSDASAVQFWTELEFKHSGEELDRSHHGVFQQVLEAK